MHFHWATYDVVVDENEIFFITCFALFVQVRLHYLIWVRYNVDE